MKATEKSQPVIFENIENRIIALRGEKVLLDCDVAALYGVATKEINQAVRNNAEKFPEGYVFTIDKHELMDLRSKILTANNPKSRVFPKAFTEKGLYMLATILKGERATQTTELVRVFAEARIERSESPCKVKVSASRMSVQGERNGTCSNSRAAAGHH